MLSAWTFRVYLHIFPVEVCMTADVLAQNSILSRKHLSGDRMEIRFSAPDGELRLGRVFPFQGEINPLESVLRMMSEMKVSGIHFPDRLAILQDGRYCLSIPAEGLTAWEGPPQPLERLIEPVIALHDSGWLNLDITPQCFINVNGDLEFICWGSGLVGSPSHPAPEIIAGAPPNGYSDLFMLGQTLIRSRGYLWNGSDQTAVELMSRISMEDRIKAVSGIPDAPVQFKEIDRYIKDPIHDSVTFLHGGEWKRRDTVTSIMSTSVIEKGWIARYIRCTPRESLRPLPGRPHTSQSPIDSGSALLRELFPVMSGVQRLLVVDQIEFASSDLAAILSELTRVRPPGLTLLLTSSCNDPGFDIEPEHLIHIDGEPSVAHEWSLDNLPAGKAGTGFPAHADSSVLYRCTGGAEVPPRGPISCEQLLEEGAYRVLTTLTSEEVQGDLQTAVTESLLRLGRFEEVLAQCGPEPSLPAAKAHLALGDAITAESVIRKISIVNDSREDILLLLAESLLKQVKLSEAEELLLNLAGTRSALLLARTMDLMGRAPEALPSIRRAMAEADGEDLVELLCSESNISMRMGDYSRALEAASAAVDTSRDQADIHLMAASLRERGRVREVLGRWADALDDYRLSLSYASDAPAAIGRPSLTDLYVLELKTGELRSSIDTFNEMKRNASENESATSRQLISLLTAYRGVLLGLGSIFIPDARRSVAMAAEQELSLGHALSLLYLGQLLTQEGEDEEAREILSQARARASLMGDRHLILLVDLALAGTGRGADVSRLIMEARELGLEMEALEARILLADDPSELSSLIADLLDVPSPLKAFELVRLKGVPSDPEVRKNLLRAFRTISTMLEGDELAAFLARNSMLAEELEKLSSEQRLQRIRNDILIVSEWISSQHSHELDLTLLRKELGLSSLSLVPQNGIGEERVSAKPDLFASGSDLTSLRMLAPLIAAVAGAGPATLPESDADGDLFEEMIGRSQSMLDLKRRMLQVSGMHVPVLIIGKTGTGKELVARGVHSKSHRSDGPFIAVDCGAIAESLLESELFGALRGAYTGSSSDRQGLMEAANGGTLFLDEIGNLPASLQVKLLRALETGRIRRLGDTVERTLDFRLICATNADLLSDSTSGEFRSDLYYRIAVMILRLPSLAERAEDIPLLVDHFAGLTAPDDVKPVFSRDALRTLAGYSWPGNIRELRNVVQRAVLFASGDIVGRDDIHFEGLTLDPEDRIESLEDCIITHVGRTVKACKGNRSESARLLGCDPKTVRKYLALGEQEEGSDQV